TGPLPEPVRPAPAPAPTLRDLGLARRGFVASSPQMQAVLARTVALAASDAPVFVSGEVGTGKNTLAGILHDLSPRAARPFVEVNCAALTAASFDAEIAGRHGVLDRAGGGTVFLDELFDLPADVQPLMLQLIEATRADPALGRVRFVAASGRDPRAVLREGRFRPDLYYRLHVAPIALPPLRTRDGDLPLIARTRLAQMSETEGRGFTGFSDPAMGYLLGYDWPGNLRELINVIWTVVLMNEGPLVTPDLLPPEIREALPRAPGELPLAPRHPPAPAGLAPRPGAEPGFGAILGKTLAEIERAVIEATILAEDGSVPRAARVLDVSPSTLYRKRDAWAKRTEG
ncbi:MAG: sigma-54-dependent Fis family transcriptional regulator, partial [Maritimibacter sp.]|nr:sigma-54-dependent Fis family transcriptional regulator [Maritimibacter sp.]